MVSTSFRHFVLAIMVLLLATKACDANSDEGFKKVEAEAGNGIMPPGGKEMHNAKEIYNAGPRVAADTSGKFGGRKMMLEIKGLSNEVKKEETKKTSEEASKISGRNDRSKNLKKSAERSLTQSYNQYDRRHLKANSKNEASSETAVTRPSDLPKPDQLCSQECATDSNSCSSKCSSVSKSSVSKKSDQDQDSFQNLDSEKLLKAASQIVNLMNKDYRGDGGPRHRSPINNREPLH
nr:uncharacterized protein LOC113740626 [Coffea arabica]